MGNIWHVGKEASTQQEGGAGLQLIKIQTLQPSVTEQKAEHLSGDIGALRSSAQRPLMLLLPPAPLPHSLRQTPGAPCPTPGPKRWAVIAEAGIAHPLCIYIWRGRILK